MPGLFRLMLGVVAKRFFLPALIGLIVVCGIAAGAAAVSGGDWVVALKWTAGVYGIIAVVALLIGANAATRRGW